MLPFLLMINRQQQHIASGNSSNSKGGNQLKPGGTFYDELRPTRTCLQRDLPVVVRWRTHAKWDKAIVGPGDPAPIRAAAVGSAAFVGFTTERISLEPNIGPVGRVCSQHYDGC